MMRASGSFAVDLMFALGEFTIKGYSLVASLLNCYKGGLGEGRGGSICPKCPMLKFMPWGSVGSEETPTCEKGPLF